MVIKTQYGIGETVYLKTDPDQHVRMITAIKVGPYDHFYTLNKGTEISDHYDIEISKEKDQNIFIGIDSSDTQQQ